MFFSGGQISPSSVGLKSPSGGGEIQPIRGEKMTNEYDADSELPYTRESHGTRNRRPVNTRWGATEYAGGSRSLQVALMARNTHILAVDETACVFS